MMRLKLLVLLGVCVLGQGCGSGNNERPAEVYHVSGHVTHQGKPVTNADITFVHSETQRYAFGRTDDSGFYRLTTFTANDGAVAGKHSVTVVKVEPPPQTTQEAPVESAEYVPPTANQSTTPTAPKSLLPDIYASQSTTTLIAIVEAKDENTADLKLE